MFWRVGEGGSEWKRPLLVVWLASLCEGCHTKLFYICSRAAEYVSNRQSSRSWRQKGKSVPASHGLEVRLMGENMSQGWNEGHFAKLLVATVALTMLVETVRKQAFVVFPTLQQFLISSCNYLFPLPVSTQVPIILLMMYLLLTQQTILAG